MKPKKAILAAAAVGLFSLLGQPVFAGVELRFVESAPKDSFSVQNTGKCALSSVSINIDLESSHGRLIFDTAEGGTGVEVFQPFEVKQGNLTLKAKDKVGDGDTALTIDIPELGVGELVSFTIDVDDRLPNSNLGNIRVDGSEIANSLVSLYIDGSKTAEAVFRSDSKATIALSDC